MTEITKQKLQLITKNPQMNTNDNKTSVMYKVNTLGALCKIHNFTGEY